MAGNGILKRGGERLPGTVRSSCGHGRKPAAFHPPLCRRAREKAPEEDDRFAVNVRSVSGKGETERKPALAEFIRDGAAPRPAGEGEAGESAGGFHAARDFRQL